MSSMPKCAAERLDHLLALALAHEPGVDEHARELRADGLVHEGGGDGGVDAARQPADGPAGADLGADRARPACSMIERHRPRRPAAAGVVEEPLQQLLARAACARPRGGTARRRSPRPATRTPPPAWSGVDAVTAKPSGASVIVSKWLIHTICSRGRSAPKSMPPSSATDELGAAVLAPARLGDLAAEVAGDELAAVADAEHRDAGVVDGRVDRRRAVGVHRRRPAGEDHALRALRPRSSAAVIVCGTISL